MHEASLEWLVEKAKAVHSRVQDLELRMLELNQEIRGLRAGMEKIAEDNKAQTELAKASVTEK